MAAHVDGRHILRIRRAIVQTYMVIRCWRLLNCRLWFIIVAGLAIAVALAGALWSVSATCKSSERSGLFLHERGQLRLLEYIIQTLCITAQTCWLSSSLARSGSGPLQRLTSSSRRA